MKKQLNDNESEFKDLKREVITLRNLIEERDREMMNNLVYYDWERKESLFREKSDKENYQKQIEDLFTQLKDVKHCCWFIYNTSNKAAFNISRKINVISWISINYFLSYIIPFFLLKQLL